jgi:hypothetical protein
MLQALDSDVADGCAGGLAQRIERGLAGAPHLGLAVVPRRPGDDPDPQAVRVAGGELLAEQHAAEQPAVRGVGAQRAGHDRGRVAEVVALHRRAAERRLETRYAAVRRGIADRAHAVGPHRTGDQPTGDRGARAARGAPRAALGVPGVACGAVGGDVSRAPGTVLVHVRDPDDHRSGVAQRAVRSGLAGVRRREQLRRAEALRAPRERPLVLDRDRDAAERAVGSIGEHPPRLVGKRRHDRVQRRVAILDPLEGCVEQLAGIGVAHGDRRGLLPQRSVQQAHGRGG